MAALEQQIAVQYLDATREGLIDISSGEQFDDSQYSRMKYGDRLATQDFAGQLAKELIDKNDALLFAHKPPEFFVAYKEVPPACFYLSRFCLDLLNEERNNIGNEPGRLVRIYKSKVLTTNYAAASPEARVQELGGIDFTLEGRSVSDTQAVVLDDIRITGSAERKILEVLRPGNPAHISLGYVAIVNELQALENPQIENELNHGVITCVADLLPSIQSDNFDLNIRTLKMILAAEPAELESLLASCPQSLIDEMYRGAVNTGVAFTRSYPVSFDILAKFRSAL